LTEWFILFGHQACKTQIKSIATFGQGDDILDLACSTVATVILEYMYFLQVKASRTIRKKPRHIRSAICINRDRHRPYSTRLEAVVGVDKDTIAGLEKKHH
jgi:hypothetical protein